MKKKILLNVVLNIIASFVPIFALQFIILPKVAISISAESYGQLITIVAFVNISASSFGIALNNSRLLHFKDYKDIRNNGDYNIILGIFLIGNTLLVLIGMFFLGQSLDFMDHFLINIFSVLMVLYTYGNVEFRINLNYKHIFLTGLILFSGYLIGYISFLITGYWPLIYVFGFGASIIYIYINTGILKERFIKRSPIFKSISIKTIFLLGSSFLVIIVTYIDKLIIYSVLGGYAVSIYYTATILGKTIALVIGPITSVMLSYFAQMRSFNTHLFKLLLGISFTLGLLGYISIMLISEPLLSLIYPQYMEESLRYISITSISIIITIISDIINTVMLKFRDLKWQIYINGIHMILFIILSFVLLDFYGLMGFCIGVMIASILKLLVMILLYYQQNKQFARKI